MNSTPSILHSPKSKTDFPQFANIIVINGIAHYIIQWATVCFSAHLKLSRELDVCGLEVQLYLLEVSVHIQMYRSIHCAHNIELMDSGTAVG